MAQIKSKQIKLVAQGDLIYGNGSANGTTLPVGAANTVLSSNGTQPSWGKVAPSAISLTQGDILVGGAGNVAVELSASSQGQVIVADSSGNLTVGSLAAQYVTYTPNSAANITSTNVQTAITEVANEHSYVHVTNVDPTASNDSTDTAGLGVQFKIGDIWVNTATDNVWHLVDSSSSTAVWVRSSGIAGAFVYKGNLDAGDTGDTLPSSPQAGDWYRISAASGTQNFNGAWDAAGEPNGVTFEVGDAVVYGADGNWHKVDNTDPTIASSGDGITVTGGPATYTVNVNADESTITSTGGAGNAELAVHGGSSEQVLLGQGTSADAVWGYVENLRGATSGELIIDGVSATGAANYFIVENALTGNAPIIRATGTDTNVNLVLEPKGAGTIMLDGTSWPTTVAPVNSLLVSETAGELTWSTAPTSTGDQVLVFNDTSGNFEWTARSDIGGNAYGVISTDAGTVTADSTSDTLTVTGGTGVTVSGDGTTETITVTFNSSGMADVTVTGTDTVPFFDASNASKAEFRSWNDVITDLNIVTTTGTGQFWSSIKDNQTVPNTASADSDTDELTFAGGVGIKTTVSDDPETVTFDLDIDSLTTTTPDLTNDYVVLYDTSLGEHRKVLANSIGGAAFASISGDSGTAVADSSSDTMTIAGGNGISTSAQDDPEILTIIADVDGVTLTSTGGTGAQLAVSGGSTGQVLTSQGPTDAAWNYVSDLRDGSGNFIIDGSSVVASVNHLGITNATTGNSVKLSAEGFDSDVDLELSAKNAGRVNIDGTLFPSNGVTQFSILGTNTTNDLSAITASDGSGDQVLVFNDATNSIEWQTSAVAFGNKFTTITGNTGTASADTFSDSLEISGTSGITTTVNNIGGNAKVSAALSISSLSTSSTFDQDADTLVVYDASSGTHVQGTINNVLAGSDVGTPAEDESVAVGGVNETFTSFFTDTPLSDDSVIVYFNGLKLRSSGWTRSGNDLTLVDTINGYGTDAGDIISASYEY